MKALKIEYTVKPEYVNTNKANINAVVNELRESGHKDILYSVYLKEDGVSFMHFVIFENEKANIIPGLAAFKKFNEQLKAEGLTAPPQTTKLDMVDKSFDL